MNNFIVVLSEHFVLADGGFTTRTPGYRFLAFVEPTVLMTGMDEMPDHVVVGIAHGEVGIVPVHEITQALRLLSLNVRIFLNPVFAFLDEFGDSILFYVLFVLKS